MLEYYSNPDKIFLPKLLCRPTKGNDDVMKSVDEILLDVKEHGDEALFRLAEKFDGSRPNSLFASPEEFDEAEKLVCPELKKALEEASCNIRKFHEAQIPHSERMETQKGVLCYRRIVPISRVGLYVPSGTAPLFSTVLMLAIPASVAGCRDIVLATPAKEGKVNPCILYAAKLSGVHRVMKVGGAQAVAAFAYGTESISPRDKIFGPGNRFVSFAKLRVSSFVAIDMLAGPSEVMVVADKSSDPVFVASDLLSQAEHGNDSQVVLLIREDEQEAKRVYENVKNAICALLKELPRASFMQKTLENSVAISYASLKDILDAVNLYAPEHLIINTLDCDELVEGVENAGSVFLGPYSPESAGDYASGTNHTLPTSGWARSSSGVSTDSFIKKITVQKLTKEGAMGLSETVMEMAESESLYAHRKAMEVRTCR